MQCRYVTFPVKRSGADVLVTLQISQDDNGDLVCGLRWLEGRIDLKPRAMRKAIIEELAIIEQVAKEAGCVEMRHAGDDRGWALPGYEPMPELRNGRRKRL